MENHSFMRGLQAVLNSFTRADGLNHLGKNGVLQEI